MPAREMRFVQSQSWVLQNVQHSSRQFVGIAAAEQGTVAAITKDLGQATGSTRDNGQVERNALQDDQAECFED